VNNISIIRAQCTPVCIEKNANTCNLNVQAVTVHELLVDFHENLTLQRLLSSVPFASCKVPTHRKQSFDVGPFLIAIYIIL
jgi:hypothetical protein